MSDKEKKLYLGEVPLFIQQIIEDFYTRFSLSPEEKQFIFGENCKGEDDE